MSRLQELHVFHKSPQTNNAVFNYPDFQYFETPPAYVFESVTLMSR